MTKSSLCIFGAGNMGEALIKGMLQSMPASQIGVIEKNPERASYIKNKYGISLLADYQKLKGYDILILCIKPQTFAEIDGELGASLDKDCLVLSILAGTTIKSLKKIFATQPIARVMPNTPALINEGMSALCFSDHCNHVHKETSCKIFSSIGKIAVVQEEQLNAITAISGSGPAYIFAIAEYFAQEAKAIGLEYKLSLELITQTLLGSAKLIQTQNKTPAELISQVASPGGTTEAALKVLQASPLSDIIRNTIVAAKNRADVLSGKED